ARAARRTPRSRRWSAGTSDRAIDRTRRSRSPAVPPAPPAPAARRTRSPRATRRGASRAAGLVSLGRHGFVSGLGRSGVDGGYLFGVGGHGRANLVAGHKSNANLDALIMM